MWPLILVIWFLRLSTALAAEDTDYLIKDHPSRHQDFKWHFHFSRLLSTPEWDVEKRPVPLDPGKAWQIAKKWMKKHGCERPELLQIQISPFIPQHQIGQLDPRLSKRFYYTIRCIPAPYDSMVVYVLLDGSILEPVKPPHKGLW